MARAARSRSGLMRLTAGIITNVAIGSITCIIPSHTAIGLPISSTSSPDLVERPRRHGRPDRSGAASRKPARSRP